MTMKPMSAMNAVIPNVNLVENLLVTVAPYADVAGVWATLHIIAIPTHRHLSHLGAGGRGSPR